MFAFFVENLMELERMTISSVFFKYLFFNYLIKTYFKSVEVENSNKGVHYDVLLSFFGIFKFIFFFPRQ